MPDEEFREQLNKSLDAAIMREADLDDIDAALTDALERVREVRVMRGELDPEQAEVEP